MAGHQVEKNVWIELSDKTRLASRLWLPEKVSREKVPVIIEYIPYRKNDIKALRDSGMHSYFAERGHACLRVDMRGSGDSDGILKDEYLAQELEDGIEVINWAAKRPWCNGRVGMMGLSWGGFNALQIAALNPPALKAIITVSSSDDRYNDDVHYMGGCLLSDNLSWASNMFAFNSFPPDPLVVGPGWKQMWRERLNANSPWTIQWLEHQRRDAYWKHASVCEDYNAIKIPVYAIGGFADGYTNTVFRLVENLSSFCKGLVGPWGHKYPHHGNPGQGISFLDEASRWWDRWLKEENNGIEKEPRLQVWMQDSFNPLTLKRPGRWISEPGWPSPSVQERVLHLRDHLLTEDPSAQGVFEEINIRSPLSVGLYAGKWCSYSASTDLPSDQRLEDGGSSNFETDSFEQDLEVFGAPQVTLSLSVDRPLAQVAARIGSVSESGEVTRVTYGVLNLTHWKSHEAPSALVPGQVYTITIPLNFVAQRFAPGQRLRLSLSSSYWPLAWPSPYPVNIKIYPQQCFLSLPCRQSLTHEDSVAFDHHPDHGNTYPHDILIPAHREWVVRHNLATNEAALCVKDDDAKIFLRDTALAFQRKTDEEYRYTGNQYGSLMARVKTYSTFERKDWQVTTRTTTRLTAQENHFKVLATLDAYEGDARIFSRSWDEEIPRDCL